LMVGCRIRGEEVVAYPLYRGCESEEGGKIWSIIMRKYIKAIRWWLRRS